MEQVAAQGELIFHDDTAVRILALMQENSDRLAAAQAQGMATPPDRTGMHTTALVVKVGEHTAILYYSSRRHAGENLQGLLDKREAGLAKPLAMSDALASNAVADDAAVIRCHCLAHGRRKFSDLAEVFPHECQVVLEVLSQVFDHDEQARQAQLSPEARLAYHQAQSQPLMDGLKGWLDQQIDEHLVEPNSALGKAIGYMQHHWDTLTRFLSVPGAPLDNNLAERALKLFIRQRNNSLFYKSTHSAYIASVLTSLIATCLYAGVNAVEYLVALQEHRPRSGRTRRRGCPGPMPAAGPRLRPGGANPAPSGRASGLPFQSTMSSSRADKGTRASATGGPPVKAPLREPLHHHPVALAVIEQEFERRARAVAEDIDGALQGLSPRRWRHTAPSPSMPLRKSTGSVATKMRLCGVSWSMQRPSTKARTSASSGSADGGAVDAQPGAIGAGQLDLVWRRAAGARRGQRHFHKAQGMGGGVTGAGACGVAICFLRSVRRNRNCLATREGGKAAASATA